MTIFREIDFLTTARLGKNRAWLKMLIKKFAQQFWMGNKRFWGPNRPNNEKNQ